MTPTITGLSPREADFLARLAASGQTVFGYEELQAAWQGSSPVYRTLSRLHKGGWIERIERGRYLLLPLEAGPDRLWSESALVVASHLAQPGAVAYWSALHYWNLTEQVPRTVFVQSPRRRYNAVLAVGGVRYHFVQISSRRFFGLAERTVDGQPIRVTDPEKSIVDAVHRPELCGGTAQLAETLQAHWAELDWPRLDGYLARFGSGALYKRLGYLVEALDLPIPGREQRLDAWQKRLTAGLADLDPERGGRGIAQLRWRVRDNIDLAAVIPGEDA
jgi:predicted transcriptional regulator of viral defense system